MSFDVHAGEIFGLLGPNGAGKSTLIRILMDIIRADSGEVRVFGEPGVASISIVSATCRRSAASTRS